MKHKILLGITVFLFISLGVSALVLCKASFIGSKYFIGGAFIAINIPTIFIYISHGYYKSYAKIPYVILVVAGIAIGTLFLLSDNITIISMCITWGAFDIAAALYKAYDASTELKENKFELIEIAACVTEIVFGILLIIHLSHGITAHLISLGVCSIAVAVKYSIDLFRPHHHE